MGRSPPFTYLLAVKGLLPSQEMSKQTCFRPATQVVLFDSVRFKNQQRV